MQPAGGDTRRYLVIVLKNFDQALWLKIVIKNCEQPPAGGFFHASGKTHALSQTCHNQ